MRGSVAVPGRSLESTSPQIMKTLIFLDFDDVIAIDPDYTSSDVVVAIRSADPHLPVQLWSSIFHPVPRGNLKQLHQKFRPEYVISSTWATYLSLDEIRQVLTRGGLGFVAEALHANWRSAVELGSFRATEIAAWLRMHAGAGPVAYVILDDASSGRTLVGSPLECRTVFCKEWTGFTAAELERAVEILLAQKNS